MAVMVLVDFSKGAVPSLTTHAFWHLSAMSTQRGAVSHMKNGKYKIWSICRLIKEPSHIFGYMFMKPSFPESLASVLQPLIHCGLHWADYVLEAASRLIVVTMSTCDVHVDVLFIFTDVKWDRHISESSVSGQKINLQLCSDETAEHCLKMIVFLCSLQLWLVSYLFPVSTVNRSITQSDPNWALMTFNDFTLLVSRSFRIICVCVRINSEF